MVAGAGQELRQGLFSGQPVEIADDRFGLLEPVVDANLGGRAPGQEAGPRGGADGTRGEGIGEANAFRCQPVQVGRLQFAVAIASIRPLAVVVGEEEKDIGTFHGNFLSDVMGV